VVSVVFAHAFNVRESGATQCTAAHLDEELSEVSKIAGEI
jgi:hypothetical protein